MKKVLLFVLPMFLTGCFGNNVEVKTNAKGEQKIIVDNAFTLLKTMCPRIADSKDEVFARYNSFVVPYRSESLGWKSEVEFKFTDSSNGITNYIYVGNDDKNAGIVVKKQDTLEYCNIQYDMNGVDPYCHIESGEISCSPVITQ
ncbi:hypothetical protein [Photobacterium damselae]|uniref:hypothetical protein n=1 Tax=Photobacterium damselae TaxID=38293 RepID=UPI0035A8995A